MIPSSYSTPKTREEWLALRKGRMTSSLVAAAIGLDDYATPLQAWAAITGREAFDGNKATVRGTRLESAVLDYPTRGGHLARKPAPFALGNDGWSADSTDCLYKSPHGLLLGEGKTVAQGGADAWGEEGTDDVPERVLVQSCWHLAHWPEAQSVIVPVLFGGYTFEFREYVVVRDDDLIGQVVDAAHRFWVDYVRPDKAPPASSGDDAALRHLWPRHTAGKWLPPSAEVEQLVRAYIAARDAEADAEEQKKEHGAKLRQLLADAEGCSGRGFKVTYKYQGGKAITDWEGLARHIGVTDEHVQQFTRVGEGYRVLRASLPAEKKGKAVANG